MRSCARYSQADDDKTVCGHTSESDHTFKKIYWRTSINSQKIWWGIILLRIGTKIIHTVKVTQSCQTGCHPMDCAVHGILQARILEWVAIPFSRWSSQPRDWTQVSRIAGGFFTSWATREAQEYWSGQPIPSPGDLPDPGIKWGLLRCRQIPHQLSYHGNG